LEAEFVNDTRTVVTTTKIENSFSDRLTPCALKGTKPNFPTAREGYAALVAEEVAESRIETVLLRKHSEDSEGFESFEGVLR
jgi:hypothetical protein